MPKLNDLVAAEADLKRMEAALKPFAALGRLAMRTPGDCQFGTMSVSIVDLIRAAHALGQDEDGK